MTICDSIESFFNEAWYAAATVAAQWVLVGVLFTLAA